MLLWYKKYVPWSDHNFSQVMTVKHLWHVQNGDSDVQFCPRQLQVIICDGLVQERCNSIANALELCLCSTNPSICDAVVRFGSRYMRFGDVNACKVWKAINVDNVAMQFFQFSLQVDTSFWSATSLADLNKCVCVEYSHRYSLCILRLKPIRPLSLFFIGREVTDYSRAPMDKHS